MSGKQFSCCNISHKLVRGSQAKFLFFCPTMYVTPSQLECRGARMLGRLLQLVQVNRQTRFGKSNSFMPIKFIALAPLFL